MKKIIINKHDEHAIEVSLNNSFGPHMGMTPLSYRQLLIMEDEVFKNVKAIIKGNELPKLVQLLPEVCPELQPEVINETLRVLTKVSSLLKDKFHVAIINSILDITNGHSGGFGVVFDSRFQPLCDKDTREDFWGTRWELPCYITKGLLIDLMNGIDVNNPSSEDLKKSEVFHQVSLSNQCSQKKIDDFIAAFSAK